MPKVLFRNRADPDVAIIPDLPMTSGQVRFNASVDHATTDYYEVRIRAQGSETILVSEDIGKPTPSPQGTITVDITWMLEPLPPGNYIVAVAAVNVDGAAESEPDSNVFSLPL